MKKVIPLLCIIMLINTGFMVILGFDVKNVKGVNDPTQPPDGGTVEVDGDWFVEDVREYHNCTIIMDGNLMINSTGSLTFHNVTLKMNCTYDGQYSIEVKSGGAFYIYDCDNDPLTTYDRSNITATNSEYEYLFWVRYESKFEMKNSELHECGYDEPYYAGLTIQADNTVIENNLISSNRNGIKLDYADSTLIINNTIDSNSKGIYTSYSTHDQIINNTITNSFHGMYIHGSEYSEIVGNTVSSSTYCAISMQQSMNNKVVNNAVSDTSGIYGISIDHSDNEQIINTTIDQTDEYGIAAQYSNNITVLNSTITNSGIYDFHIPYRAQVFAINTTFNTNSVYFEDDVSNLTVKWFMHVKTIDEMGQSFPNVDVSVEDVFNDNIHVGITDATGYCRWIVCTQYVQNKASKLYHTPHNVKADDGIHTNWTDAYMDETKEVIVQLDTLSYSRYLNRGWNQISIPLIQTDTNLRTVLRLIEGKYDIVRYFNPTSLIDHWRTYRTFVPNGYNDLAYLNHKMGLWINITSSDGVMFTVTGEKPSSTHIQLYKGWNLVGYPSFTDRNVSEALEGILYEQVEGFNENAPPYYLKILSNSDIMTAGYGYWIRVTSDCVWTIYN